MIKRYEGFRFKAYKCPAGVWTIGYGHTKGVKRGDYTTHPSAERMLLQDISEIEEQLSKLITTELSQNQWDAIVSFVYNIGVGAFSRSTLLRRLNAGEFEKCSTEIQKWVYCKGVVVEGLKRRRIAEAELFCR